MLTKNFQLSLSQLLIDTAQLFKFIFELVYLLNLQCDGFGDWLERHHTLKVVLGQEIYLLNWQLLGHFNNTII